MVATAMNYYPQILAIIPKISSTISLLAEVWIITEVCRSSKKRTSVYHRLLVGLATASLFRSLGHFLSTWTIPKETSSSSSSSSAMTMMVAGTSSAESQQQQQSFVVVEEGDDYNYDYYGNIGNDATCNVQGFAIQFGVACPIYLVMISIYYWLTIRHGWSELGMKRIEKYLHIIPWMIGIITASIGFIFHLYNPMTDGWYCWIAPAAADTTFPPFQDCSDTEYDDDETIPSSSCIIRREESYTMVSTYRLGLYYIPLWTCFVLITYCLGSVYVGIRREELRSMKYRHPELSGSESQTMSSYNNSTTSTSIILQAKPKVNFANNNNNNNTVGGRERPMSEDTMSLHLDDLDEEESLEFSVLKANTTDDSNRPGGGGDGGRARLFRNGQQSMSSLFGGPSTRAKAMIGSQRNLFSGVQSFSPTFFGGSVGKLGESFNFLSKTTELANSSSSSSSKNGRVWQWLTCRCCCGRKDIIEEEHRTSISQQVASQVLWYVVVFLIAHYAGTLDKVYESIYHHPNSIILILQVIFEPLQGFLDFCVYRRPVYVKLRKQNREVWKIHTLLQAFQWPGIENSSNYDHPKRKINNRKLPLTPIHISSSPATAAAASGDSMSSITFSAPTMTTMAAPSPPSVGNSDDFRFMAQSKPQNSNAPDDGDDSEGQDDGPFSGHSGQLLSQVAPADQRQQRLSALLPIHEDKQQTSDGGTVPLPTGTAHALTTSNNLSPFMDEFDVHDEQPEINQCLERDQQLNTLADLQIIEEVKAFVSDDIVQRHIIPRRATFSSTRALQNVDLYESEDLTTRRKSTNSSRAILNADLLSYGVDEDDDDGDVRPPPTKLSSSV